MNLNNIIKKLSKKTGLTNNDTEKIVQTLLSSFKRYLRNSDKIELRGLGSFYIKKRKPRNVNLATKKIESPEHYGIIFKESYNLKKSINQEGVF